MNWELIGKLGGAEIWDFRFEMETFYKMEERVILRAPDEAGKRYRVIIDGEYYTSSTSSTRQIELKIGQSAWEYVLAPTSRSQYSKVGFLEAGEEVLLRRTSNNNYTINFVGSLSLIEETDEGSRKWGPETVEEVSLKDMSGDGTVHPLVDWEPPRGEVWAVSIEGSFSQGTNSGFLSGDDFPRIMVGGKDERATSTSAFMLVNGNILPGGSPPAIRTGSYRDMNFDGVIRVRKAKL